MTEEDIFDLLAIHALDAHRVRSSRHAAMILSRGHPISIGLNRKKTHPMMFKFSRDTNKVQLHAEIDAITRAVSRHGSDILDGADLFVLRLNQLGQISSSKPCEICQRAMDHYGLKGHWT